jgi:tetraacyldisaccharide 4'-kinase
LFFSYLKYIDPQSVFSDDTESLNSKKVVLFTGIANSKNLVDYVESNAELVHHFKFRDHYKFKKKDINKIIDCYNKIESQEKLILTTEKDAARLSLFENEFKNLSFAYLPIEVKFQGKNNFNDLILKYVEQNRVNNKVLVKDNPIST